jgi:hypothetical protein
MPKKKIVKPTKMKKTTAKTTTRQNVLSLAEKVEKEFRQIPMKLAKLYRQETAALKQQEKKLKADLKNAQATQKAAQKKQAALTSSVSKTSKKQLAAMKKTIAEATNTIKMLTKQLAQIAKTAAPLLAKQTKYTALNKELAKLDKELTAKIKMRKPTPQKKNTKVKAAKANMTQQTIEETILIASESAEPITME